MKKLFFKKIVVLAIFTIIALFFSGVAINNLYSNEYSKNQTKEISDIQTDENNIPKGEDLSKEENRSVSEDPMNVNEKTLVEKESLLSTAKQGGPLMIFLVFLGIISMTIVVERIIFFTKNSVWKGQQIEEYLREKSAGAELVYKEDLEDDLNSYFSSYANNLERGLPLLYGIGNLAPIAGFLGTVIGMISAFSAIAAATTVNAKVVAVGIQIALVTTAGGLIVAAPTLAFFYLFSHIIQNCTVKAEAIIAEETEGMQRLSCQIQKSE